MDLNTALCSSLCYSGMWVRKDITLERGLVALVSMLIHDFGSHSEKVSVRDRQKLIFVFKTV